MKLSEGGAESASDVMTPSASAALLFEDSTVQVRVQYGEIYAYWSTPVLYGVEYSEYLYSGVQSKEFEVR